MPESANQNHECISASTGNKKPLFNNVNMLKKINPKTNLKKLTVVAPFFLPRNSNNKAPKTHKNAVISA